MNVVGFAHGLPQGSLGLQVEWTERRCGGDSYGGFRCTSRVVERDILLHPGIRWERGPAHPSSREYDLHSVLLHEFGHFRGMRHTRSRCQNSPMYHSIANGEWWRSSRDWYRRGCRNSRWRPGAARAATRVEELALLTSRRPRAAAR